MNVPEYRSNDDPRGADLPELQALVRRAQNKQLAVDAQASDRRGHRFGLCRGCEDYFSSAHLHAVGIDRERVSCS